MTSHLTTENENSAAIISTPGDNDKERIEKTEHDPFNLMRDIMLKKAKKSFSCREIKY